MSVINLSIGGNVYALVENTVKKCKAGERWFAICPAKGDLKWFAKTKEDLQALLQSEEGGAVATVFKPKKILLWKSEGEYDGKPIIKWYTDGTMDVDTPTARFRIELAPVVSSGVATNLIPVAEDDFDTFCEDLLEIHDSYGFQGTLTKIRLKNPDGTTLRDIENLSVVDEGSCVSPMSILDMFAEWVIEDQSNRLVDLVRSFGENYDGDDIYSFVSAVAYEKHTLEEAQSLFMTIDAMKFIDENCDGGGECDTDGNAHHHSSDVSTEDARVVLSKLQSATVALSNIL